MRRIRNFESGSSFTTKPGELFEPLYLTPPKNAETMQRRAIK
jgi:hypothetical protein